MKGKTGYPGNQQHHQYQPPRSGRRSDSYGPSVHTAPTSRRRYNTEEEEGYSRSRHQGHIDNSVTTTRGVVSAPIRRNENYLY